MARSYRRDNNGRFSGGGGSSGGSKAAATKATNKTRAADLSAKGTVRIGARVKAKGFAGGKAAQQRAGGLRAKTSRADFGSRLRQPGSKLRKPLPSTPKASAPKRPAKMSKAPASAAKAKYKAATSKVRELKMYRGGKSDRTVKNAQRAVGRMESQRGTGRNRVPKPVQAVARAAAATFVAGQAARRMVSGRRKR